MAGKIGIGGSLVQPANDRLRNHARQDWKKTASWSFTSLLEAYTVEQRARSWLRDQGISWVLGEEMPYGGYTETFALDRISAERMVAFITQHTRRDPESK
jgi:hypothetical protein